MGFLTGKASWVRFRVTGQSLTGLVFGDDHLDRLREKAAGRLPAAADGVEVGWAAGDSVLDTDFTPAKNVHPEHLLFDFLVARDRVPAELFKAYYAAELKALAADNPSGVPSARQKREAKEAARDRVEDEARDGRFKKRVAVPVLWDGKRQEVLFGASSLTHAERFVTLFEDTFGVRLEYQSAGVVAGGFAPVDHLLPCPVVPSASDDVAWIADDSCRDYLGNEFLLWLWHRSETETDTVEHPAGDITFMFSGSLSLDCPRGQTGQDTFRHEMPVRLPEAVRAAKAGKLPRKAGLTLVRRDQQYALTLQAETLACSGVAVPKAENPKDARDAAAWRLEAVRDCVEILDDLFGVFVSVRADAAWADYLAAARRWLDVAEVGEKAA